MSAGPADIAPADLGRIWLIGAGNMGGALLARWRLAGFDRITIVDPKHADGLAAIPDEGRPDIVVLAVKPQLWLEATEALAERLDGSALVVSVMAGVTIAALAARFPAATIVRSMPNTPARIGRGITGLFSETAGPNDRARIESLFAPAGATVWLDHEDEFDAVTGLSGSGPAYVFAFIEALAAAGEAAGLGPMLAARLARATVTGSAALADSTDESPAALRIAVTSPNGTTAAGLAVLEPALAPLLRKTVAAAQSRSRELGRMD